MKHGCKFNWFWVCQWVFLSRQFNIYVTHLKHWKKGTKAVSILDCEMQWSPARLRCSTPKGQWCEPIQFYVLQEQVIALMIAVRKLWILFRSHEKGWEMQWSPTHWPCPTPRGRWCEPNLCSRASHFSFHCTH